MDPLFRWVLLFVFAIGAPFGMVGVWQGYRTYSELRSAERTQGTVTANRLVTNERDGNQEQSYRPEVSFETARGERIHFTDAAASLPPDYAVGAQVPITYQPDAPERARITSWKRLWLVPTLLTLVGLLPAAIAGLLLLRASRA